MFLFYPRRGAFLTRPPYSLRGRPSSTYYMAGRSRQKRNNKRAGVSRVQPVFFYLFFSSVSRRFGGRQLQAPGYIRSFWGISYEERERWVALMYTHNSLTGNLCWTAWLTTKLDLQANFICLRCKGEWPCRWCGCKRQRQTPQNGDD